MGYGRWDDASRSTYGTFTRDSAHKTTEEIYGSRRIHADLNPKGVKVRESRDSAENPESTPIIIGLDVTGSMGILADNIAREGLGIAFDALLDKKPVTDPHLMFMGIGDANCDSAPLQVSQFEADASIIEQITNLFIEHGGGGNHFESYNLPWYFGAFHTVHDAMEKRGKRGYLFTVGDEETPGPLTVRQIDNFIGDTIQSNLSGQELLGLCSRVYDCYHIIIEEGSYARNRPTQVRESWEKLMGQNVIGLSDHTKLAQTVVSAIQVAEGHPLNGVADAWDAATGKIVHEAVKNLTGPSPTA